MEPSTPAIAVALNDDMRRAFFDPGDYADLESLGRVRVCPSPGDLTTPAALSVLADAHILITGWGAGKLTGEVLDAAPHLGAVIHTGGSVRDFVTPEVFARGIQVSSQTALNAEPVAEYCLATIILAAKGVWRATRMYAQTKARVNAFADFPHVGFYGSTIGIVGLSKISRRVIEMLRPFNVNVMVYSSYLTEDEAASLGVRKASLAEVMGADVISVHSAATPANHGLVSAEMLALIKPGATFINTARGIVVDQEALTRELTDGRFDALLDVTWPEITPADSPLWTMPNVIQTPHWAGSLGRELFRLGRGAVTNVREYLAGAPLTGQVDAELAGKIA